MVFMKCLLQRVQAVRARCHALHGRETVTARLDGEHQARPNRLPVELHRACPAHTVFAAQVSPRQAGLIADEVGEQEARLDLGGEHLPVDLHRNPSHHSAVPAARSDAFRNARSVIVRRSLTR